MGDTAIWSPVSLTFLWRPDWACMVKVYIFWVQRLKDDTGWLPCLLHILVLITERKKRKKEKGKERRGLPLGTVEEKVYCRCMGGCSQRQMRLGEPEVDLYRLSRVTWGKGKGESGMRGSNQQGKGTKGVDNQHACIL